MRNFSLRSNFITYIFAFACCILPCYLAGYSSGNGCSRHCGILSSPQRLLCEVAVDKNKTCFTIKEL